MQKGDGEVRANSLCTQILALCTQLGVLLLCIGTLVLLRRISWLQQSTLVLVSRS